MKYTTVQAVASRLIDQFAVEMSLDQIVIHSAQVLKNMGMISLQKEVIRGTVENFCINLPAKVRQVRGVVRLDGLTDAGSSVTFQDIYFPPQTIWVSPPAEDISTLTNETIRNNYIPQITGPYIPYVWECPYLRFNETDIDVAIIATSIKLDKTGFPMIPDDAFEAAVYYCLYVYYQPLFILGKIDGQRFGVITEWKNQKMRFAESSVMLTELSQNEMNEVFNVLTSFDRKAFGIDS